MQLKTEMNPKETLRIYQLDLYLIVPFLAIEIRFTCKLWLHFKYTDHHNNISDSSMEEWDQASNDFVLRCNSCWRTNASTKIIHTSREKYYCLDCLATFDLYQGEINYCQAMGDARLCLSFVLH